MELNKITTIILICFGCFFASHTNAQTYTKYWVKLKDKNGSPYTIGNPSAFLSAKSIARRTNQGIAIDETDLPINQTYINQINATGAQVFQSSKWLNAAIVVITNTLQLSAVNSLTCVLNSSPVGKLYRTSPSAQVNDNKNTFKTSSTITSYNYGPSYTQAHQIGADCMQ